MADEMGLTRLERSMWDCLVRADGAVVSPRELAVEALGWQAADHWTDLEVRQYVLKLRQKLGDYSAIENVRGKGYRLGRSGQKGQVAG